MNAFQLFCRYVFKYGYRRCVTWNILSRLPAKVDLSTTDDIKFTDKKGFILPTLNHAAPV